MIALGSDHGGYDLKCQIEEYLEEKGYEYQDFGCFDRKSCDYPDFGKAAARAVADGQCDRGIVVCTSGIGISIAANKVPGVRAAVCSDTTTARLVKEHNNANIIAFGARIVGIEVAKDIVKTYLDAEFQGGRHEKRIAMIHDIENKR